MNTFAFLLKEWAHCRSFSLFSLFTLLPRGNHYCVCSTGETSPPPGRVPGWRGACWELCSPAARGSSCSPSHPVSEASTTCFSLPGGHPWLDLCSPCAWHGDWPWARLNKHLSEEWVRKGCLRQVTWLCRFSCFWFPHWHIFTKRRWSSSCGVTWFFMEPPHTERLLGAGPWAGRWEPAVDSGRLGSCPPRWRPPWHGAPASPSLPVAPWSRASTALIVMTLPVHFTQCIPDPAVFVLGEIPPQ